MDEITDKLKNLAMPSRNDINYCPSDSELESMLASVLARADNNDTTLMNSFRKLRELATIRQVTDGLFVKIYEHSLFYSLAHSDLAGFSLCANRLVGEIYNNIESCHQEEVTCLLLLYYALDASRSADFASVFYKLPDGVRRSSEVQYALDVYMALKRCDYVFWAELMERASSRQLCILKVNE